MTNSLTQNSNTLSTPKTGDSMSFTPLFSFAPQGSTAPDFAKFPYNHDFIDSEGVPRSFTRVRGHLVPVVGAEVMTAYGLGYVERVNAGLCVVRIVEFDETLEIPQYSNTALRPVTHYISASTMVSNLADAYNNALMLEASWLLQRMGASKSNQEKADRLLDLALDSDQYEVRFAGGDYGGATEFYHSRAINPNLRAKRSQAEIDAERARLKKLADSMLDDADDYDVPEGIADELAEVFGE